MPLNLERDSHTGRKLDRYEILCRMSAGGMSEIFLGFQRGVGGFTKLLVLKCIRQAGEQDPGILQMFLDEGRISAAFTHPNIAQVFDLGEHDGELFMAMEFITGATLNELARALNAQGQRIPIGFTLAAVRDTALALHYAHTFTDPAGRAQQIVHRDVAGKNIMVTFDGLTKLLDFGIAKTLARLEAGTRVQGVKGTSGYMAPEQILSKKVDGRTDLFGLGVVLHECLTGQRLFYGKTALDELQATLKTRPPPPSAGNKEVSKELDAVVMKAIEKDPDARYASTLEFARALESAAGDLFWRDAQRGELMQKHFGDRRDQARRLYSTVVEDVAAPASEGTVTERPKRPSGVRNMEPPPDSVLTQPLRPSGSMKPVRSSGSHKAPVPAPAPAPPPEEKPFNPFEDIDETAEAEEVEESDVQTVVTFPAAPVPPADFDPVSVVTPAAGFEPEGTAPPIGAGLLDTPTAVGVQHRMTPSASGTDPNTPETAAPAPASRKRLIAIAAGVGGLLVIGGLVFWLTRSGPPAPRTQVVRVEPAPPKAPEPKAPDTPAPPGVTAEPVVEVKSEQQPEIRPVEKARPPERPPVVAAAERPAVAPVKHASKPHRMALILDTNPKAEVRINERRLGNTPLNVALSPGMYELHLTGPDHVARHLKVEISASANTVLTLPLAAVPAE